MPPVWTNGQIIARLDSGLEWQTAAVSFGFPAIAPSWSAGREGRGFSPYSAEQKVAARLAIGLWDDLIAADFAEAASGARITFNNTTTSIGFAHAYYPGTWGPAGSVWTNPGYSMLAHPSVGGYGFQAILHEIGHALGLDHPGDYDGGSVTYARDALYAQDSHMYTVMSYFDADETGADWVASDGRWHYAQTPMLHDVMAIQSIYGAETAIRAGNTVYGFNATAGRWVFDFDQNAHPILTIWDAGGVDTLDFSGWTTPSRLSLVAGTYSDADAMTRNIAIAHGTNIENAIGGGGNDVVTGNRLANRIAGGGGNDTTTGALGPDTLEGGQGADRLNGGPGNDRLLGGEGIDVLIGAAGNDRLIGGEGRDVLWGSAGADTFIFSSPADAQPATRDFIKDFSSAEGDLIDISALNGVGAAEAEPLQFIGASSFSGAPGEVQLRPASDRSFLACDLDGNGVRDVLIVLLGTTSLAASDLIL